MLALLSGRANLTLTFNMQGWIKIYREILNKPIWLLSTPEQKTILITILLMANHEKNEWEWKGERYICQPGQMITSLDKIAKKAGKGISIQNVRTALLRFEKYSFLTNESTNSNRLITICNWEDYQDKETEQKNEDQSFVSPLLVGCYQDANSQNLTDNLTSEKESVSVSSTGDCCNAKTEDNKVSNSQPTGDQQAPNNQPTTNKNDKNIKNDKEDILQSNDCPKSDEEVLKEKPKRKNNTKPKKSGQETDKDTDLNKKAREAFEARYFRLFKEKYYWQAKDAGNMTRVLNALKHQREQKGLSNEDNVEVVAALTSFLNEAVKDEWIVQNFSISVLFSKFNEIVARAKAKEQERKNQKISGYEQSTNGIQPRGYNSNRQSANDKAASRATLDNLADAILEQHKTENST